MTSTKQCSKCKIIKTKNSFHFLNKKLNTTQPRCKECRNRPQKNNKHCTGCGITKSLSDFRIRKYKNKNGCVSLCLVCEKTYKNNWRKNHNDILNKKAKEKRKNDPERFKLAKYKYRNGNINNKLRENLRKRIRVAIKNNQKVGSAVKDLGCSIEELKKHLEQRFHLRSTGEEMNWDNYGSTGWHIDHITPLASFNLTDYKQFLKACYYTNLQPLWAEDNLNKSNKTNWSK